MPLAEAMASRMEARIAALAGDAPTTTTTTSAPAEGSAAGGAAPDATSASSEASESTEANGTPGEGSTSVTPPDPEETIRTKRLELLNQKLERQREARRASRLEAEARQAREAADADRQAAAAERQKWEAARGDYKKAFAEMGLSPREVYEEMTRQAIEADTPEAKLKAMQAAWKAEVDELRGVIESDRAERANERAQLAAQQHERVLVGAFQAEIKDPAFSDLRIEYDDSDLLGFVRHFDKNPAELYAHAKTYNVPLSSPDGFSMAEALRVLKAAQDAHNGGREQRRARLQPNAESPAGQTAERPVTVDGTAERRNAETISNDLASSRASDGKRKLSRQQKIEREIQRLDRR